MLRSGLGVKEIVENSKSVFYLLNEDEKQELLNQIYLAYLKKNEYVFKEGERPAGFIILAEGKVKIFKEGIGSREQIIQMIRPMGMIGYRALLAKENHNTSAVTIEESLIYTIDADFIFNTALKNIKFSNGIVSVLAKDLGFSNSRMVSLTQKHIRGRLAESLMLLKDKFGFENDGATLKVYLSREDIANLSNMTTSNCIRTLSTLANEKVIVIDGRKIKILNLQRLERVSKLG
jgi:CRP-like cAMP-binding protein